MATSEARPNMDVDNSGAVGKRAASGLGWVAVMRYANRLTGFITTLILARLIVPEAFGLIAIASMMLEAVNVMKDMGMGQALIFRRDNLDAASSTAFYLLAGVNIVIFAVLCALTPLVAKFFGEPRVTPVLLVMALSVVLFGLRAVPDALIRKELDFHRLVVPTVIPVLLASVVSIVMAYRGAGVWSLVIRSIIVELLTTVLIWKYCSFRPALIFDKNIAKELFGYGKFIVGASIMGVALYNIDKLFIGKFESTAALGIYMIAATLASVPVGELGHLVCRVMFPALSKVNRDRQKFQSGLRAAIEMSATISIPMGLGIIFFGEKFLHVLFQKEWWAAATQLQILAGAAIFRSISVLLHEGAKAAGYPQLVQWALALRLLIVAAAGFPAIVHFGVVGLCFVILGAYGIGLLVETLVIDRWGGLPARSLLSALVFPAATGVAVIGGCYWLSTLFFRSSEIVQLVFGVSIAIVVYCALTWFVKQDMIMTAYKTVRT